MTGASIRLEDLMRDKDVTTLAMLLFNTMLTKTQAQIVRVISFREYKRIVIVAHTRYGKSYTLAMAILLYILFNRDKSILLVAPTLQQTQILRNYIADFIVASPIFSEMLDINKTGVERIKKEVSKSRLTFKNNCDLLVLSAAGDANRLMGWGGDLIVPDETGLISGEVYRQKISRMLGDNPDSMLVEIGNPWTKDNHFFQHWKDPKFYKIHIPYTIGLKEGRISREFLEEQRAQLTPIEFDILYNAIFPEDYEDTLIKWDWLQHALRAPPKTREQPLKVLGVDIARFGTDLTVFCYVEIYEEYVVLRGVKDYAKQDTEVTADNIEKADIKICFDKIYLDDTGLGGGVTDKLNHREQTKRKIIPFIFGASPTTDKAKKRYLNQKAQFYFYLSKMFEDGKIYISKHDKLMRELNSIRYEVGQSSGKIRIIDPEKSPDFADSLMMACSNIRTGANYSVLEDTKGVIF